MYLKRDQIFAFLVLLPSILLIALFVYGFIGNTFYVSLTDWGKEGALAEHPVKNLVWFRNYADLFSGFLDARFRQDLVNTVFYSVLLLGGAVGGGLFMAILLDQKPKGVAVFRTLFLYPLSLSFIVTGTIWRWLVSPGGGVNVLPTFIGLPRIQFQWLSSRQTVLQFDWQYLPRLLVIMAAIILIGLGLYYLRQYNRQQKAFLFLIPGGILAVIGLWEILVGFGVVKQGILPTLGVMEEMHGFNLATIGIILAAVWQYAGYTMALYLAGLQSVPEELLEAARLDGATEWQYYLHIAIPMLKPITVSAVIILSHISLKMFDLIFAMTGPDNAAAGHPALLMYLTTFRANDFAKGAAIAVVLFLLAATFIIPYLITSYRERRG